MAQPLLELLKTRKIVHPTVVERIDLCEAKARIEISGFPWWLERTEALKAPEGRARISLDGIREASITQDCFTKDPLAEDLEEFHVTDASDFRWNRGMAGSIYLNEPLPDLLSLLCALDDFLVKTGCPFSALRFLNPMMTLSQLRACSSEYLWFLGNGPGPVCDAMAQELTRQAVSFSFHKDEAPLAGIFIQWWAGYILCDHAEIEFG